MGPPSYSVKSKPVFRAAAGQSFTESFRPLPGLNLG